MLTICPCKDCSERYQGCHGKCSRYTEWRSEYDKMKAQLAAEIYDPLGAEKGRMVIKRIKLQKRAGFYGN